MIITDRKQWAAALEEITSCDQPLLFGINEKGQLTLKNHWESDLYLAYFRGHWYASANEKKDGSENRFKIAHDLFAYGDGQYCEYLGPGGSEYASKDIPLDAETHSFLIFYHDRSLQLLIADGSRSGKIITEAFPANHHLWKFLVVVMCAMIQAYDADAAREIKDFWNYDKEKPEFEPKKIKKNVFFD